MTSNLVSKSEDSPTGQSGLVTAFLELAKPRISVMVVFSVAVAGLVSLPMALEGTGWKLVHAMFGLLLVSASGCALNQYLERYVDWLMPRTEKRPLPANRLSSVQVAVFGAVTVGTGVAWLAALVNWQSALIAVATWVIYVWIYTPLKLKTWLNTYVGAIAGALPILIGSTAVCNGTISPGAWKLFLVLLIWQFPHFMAIAWLYRKDYRNADVLMATTVDDSGKLAGWHAVLFAIGLIPVTVWSMWSPEKVGMVLLGIVILLGGWYFLASIRFFQNTNDTTARRLFRVSLWHLTAYLVLLSIATLV